MEEIDRGREYYMYMYKYGLVMFLFCPLGLDSLSSLELLTHLNNIASSNRTVILTIHQPRLEIYHMFSQIILLCQGQVSLPSLFVPVSLPLSLSPHPSLTHTHTHTLSHSFYTTICMYKCVNYDV